MGIKLSRAQYTCRSDGRGELEPTEQVKFFLAVQSHCYIVRFSQHLLNFHTVNCLP